MTNIPIIAFQKFTTKSDKERLRIAEELDWAASKVGFMYVKNLGIDPAVLDAAFASSRAFFSQPQEIKNRSGYYQEINHGYQASEQQRLDSQIAPDLKEAFTMRDVPKNRNRPEIWPSPEFYKTAKTAFDEFLRGANIVMEAFAIALDLPIDFFRESHQGYNTALRYLH